ncbi:MAG: LytTR family DNA-binding domain-containing protein [Acidobacteriia bacterium]|nr:LytTR family DNA-binding domain-containing protein [Terriglobia bacterium]
MKVLIVDDEPRARNRMARLLHSMKGIEICGISSDGAEALETIERAKPDVVLLDVQMPGLDGFEVVTELRGSSLPLVVFVTAYDQYALKAFEVSAVDYLLKPVSEERLRQALAKAEKVLQSSSAALSFAAEQYGRMAAALAAARPGYLQRVVGRRAHRICILPVSDIQAFLAEDELVFAILEQGRVLINRTLKELESQLNPDQFARVHRQAIVGLSHITEIEPMANGGAMARLRSGLSISISRRHAASLKVQLGW